MRDSWACIILLCSILSTFHGFEIHAEESCKPFATRLNLGLHFYDSDSEQMIGIRFNTKDVCDKSFAIIQRNSGSSLLRIPCTTDTFNLGSYTGYIHKCSVSKLAFGQSYSYMVYGWEGQKSNNPIPFQSSFINTRLMSNNSEIRIVALADWGFLKVKANVYDPLDKAFKSMLNLDQKIDAIYIGGDIAYDLDSFEGEYYEDFIIMLSQVGSRWPVILNNGNHEHLTLDDQIISNKSFELYYSQDNRLTVINLPFVNLFMLDPYRIVYKGEDPTQLANQFEQKLKDLAKNSPEKPVIACSHYPYRCNGNIPDCYDVRQKLQILFDKMMQYNVALYMGAHYHTYQRVYPYFVNNTFVVKQSPYLWTEGGAEDYRDNTLLSIVEGIAGNDREIIQKYPPDEPFTAAKVINNTGFGIMTLRSTSLHYEHVINKNAFNALDQWQIMFQKKEKVNHKKKLQSHKLKKEEIK